VKAKVSNPAFRYRHEKAIIVDGGTLYVMTCTLTISALGGIHAAINREYGVIDTNAADIHEAQAMFQADWDRTTPALGDANLLVSPVDARAKLLDLSAGAMTPLLVEQEEMHDTQVKDALIAAAKRGVTVQVILPGSPESDAGAGGSNADAPRLAARGVQVR
jgi:phosphatidylserine/phosphatidylglycerophosphate/cardiolipin synthase-like enzyme